MISITYKQRVIIACFLLILFAVGLFLGLRWAPTIILFLLVGILLLFKFK